MTARGATPEVEDLPVRGAVDVVPVATAGPGPDAPGPVLSVVVMHHPARGDVSELVRACAPLDVRVVEDPDPDGPPSPLRTAKRAWAAVAPGATHHLVLQDDVTPVPGFAELVLRAVRARDRHAVALYSNWNSPRNAYLVRAAAAAGQAWAPLGHDEWVPTLGLVLPADGALRLAAHLATLPDDERDDDEAVVTFCAREGYPVVATLPHLLEHGDGPSLAGNDAHGARHATVPAGDAVDPDAWDLPGLDREPARSPATPRPVAVMLERSRCTLRLLRPDAGEPLEHPFGWGWDDWSWWLGVDPAVVAHDVAVLVAGASPELGRVPCEALVELGAACWLLGHDVAHQDWPPAGPGGTAHRAAAVRTWVLSGLLPADRPEALVDELVAFGLDALRAGETVTRTAPNPGSLPTSTAAWGVTPGSASDAEADAELDPAVLAAVGRLAERDAEVVCQAAGPAAPVRVVVHDCPACGARADDAVRRLAAQVDLDGAAEHRVAGADDAAASGGTRTGRSGCPDRSDLPAPSGRPEASDLPSLSGRPEASDLPSLSGRPDAPSTGDLPAETGGPRSRATVEVLACEQVERRGLLGVEPGGRYVSRGLWVSRATALTPGSPTTSEPRRATAPDAPEPSAADLLVALAGAADALPVVARAVGDAPGRPSPAALGLQHVTGPVRQYVDLHAEARTARARELL
ncbi:hypothetical protein [Cellulosimicrobium protaetiae]|uniref:Uncharacterized protein n=1 Tax=Cellulosimicrobium protaetiae TaxID=2587808 RepID=A0A6M5UCM9_9MICO|nr:hypothetical protein [Cellulosimicrobium protaetiae]QJW35091.1 hypothetical protein FIC82_001565 [Cellulosimicrobium protaetiae]